MLVLSELTNTAEEHGEVHDSDGPPPAPVVPILGAITNKQARLFQQYFMEAYRRVMASSRSVNFTPPC